MILSYVCENVCSNWIVCDFVISQCLCLMSMPVTSGKQNKYAGKRRIIRINTLMTWTMKSWLAQAPGSWTNGSWNFIVPIYRSSNIFYIRQIWVTAQFVFKGKSPLQPSAVELHRFRPPNSPFPGAPKNKLVQWRELVPYCWWFTNPANQLIW